MRNTRLMLPAWLIWVGMAWGAEPNPQADFTGLDRELKADVRAVLRSHCGECHSTREMQGEVDLEQFRTIADVRKHPRVWLKVVEMLDSGEMPPKDARPLSADQRKLLRGWIDRYLKAEGEANAGDPGPVVLRRLNNAEYTYTIRELTGQPLNPAAEFPVDGGGGEGFTNAGNALGMSPALFTKYLDAAKGVAQHAVLLPDGFRFSASSTPSDWTNEILAEIRELYRRDTDGRGAARMQIQEIVIDTNGGGRLPAEKYLSVLSSDGPACAAGKKTFEAVAQEHGLSPKYLRSLWELLQEKELSPLLESVRQRWRTAKPDEMAALAEEIGKWQNALTRFQSVGHLKPWMVPLNPISPQQELRFKVPAENSADEVTLYLSAGTAGDGAAQDVVVWQQPRIVTPGQPDLLLKDVREFTRAMRARRDRLFAGAAKSLAAAAAAGQAGESPKLAELARQFAVDEPTLEAWFYYLGIGSDAVLKLDHFTAKMNNVGGYEFVSGWGTAETPLVVGNASDQSVRIPGNMKAHGVTVHPSPTLSTAVGWQSPLAGPVRIEAAVTHAHPECGNGVTWSLELRRGATRQRLASGVSQGAQPVKVGPIDDISVQRDDLVSLLIGPRDGNHSCDLTDVELIITSRESSPKTWSLTKDVSADIQAANPHADGFGNPRVWHFYTEPVKDQGPGSVIPAGSLLARWQAANSAEEKRKLADEVQRLLMTKPPEEAQHPDAVLYRQLSSLGGPLFAGARSQKRPADSAKEVSGNDGPGLDPALFGKHPQGGAVDPASLCVQAPAVVEIRLPRSLMEGSELVTTAVLSSESAQQGSVQVQVSPQRPDSLERLASDQPVLVAEGGAAKKRFEEAFEDFRRWFPAALCYPRIVPVDEAVTLTLYHREDDNLKRLMLSDAEVARLDRLWDELHYVSRSPLTLVDAYLQIMEYATQDRPDLVIAFEVYRKPIQDGAAAFRQRMLEAEPVQLGKLIEFASRAYRRPLADDEVREFQVLYRQLRSEELSHEDAFRFLVARILASPKFLYRLETAPAGTQATRVSEGELASRLSYFLWSSPPDAELLTLAQSKQLQYSEVLAAQTRRMLLDERTRRLATEFGCQWLHIYDFDKHDEKSEQHFPEFAALRSDIHEEAIRFMTDIFQHDGSIISLLDADYTFVNEALAKHYGLTDVTGPEWKRVDGWRKRGRGGVLGLAATMAKQSGASRTSPILRGNWVSEVLLGEKLPKPPKGVPPLPDDEAALAGLTVRQLTEQHSRLEQCAGCHVRIDPLGYALEGFDAIGRLREKDAAGHAIDTKSTMVDGTELTGFEGLRNYLSQTRRDAFVRQFCRKLLGYALGRGLQLSDEPLVTQMLEKLSQNDYRFSVAVEMIVQSPQFREIRGRDFVSVEE